MFGSLLLAIVAAIPFGCGTSQKRTILVEGTPAELGVVSVEVHNFRGDVRILVDPRRSEPRINASFRHDSYVTKPTREKTFGAAPVVASYQRQGGRIVLRIETAPGIAKSDDFSTDLTIRMPACAGVFIRTTDGHVEVVGAAGAVDIENVSSGKKSTPIIYRTQATIVDPVKLTTNNGDIFFSPGVNSKGRFQLTTRTGSVRFSARVGDVRQLDLSDAKAWVGTLNGGENPVQLHSDSGSVEVRLRKPHERVAQHF
jgi:hypothetical protein